MRNYSIECKNADELTEAEVNVEALGIPYAVYMYNTTGRYASVEFMCNKYDWKILKEKLELKIDSIYSSYQ